MSAKYFNLYYMSIWLVSVFCNLILTDAYSDSILKASSVFKTRIKSYDKTEMDKNHKSNSFSCDVTLFILQDA